MDTSRRRGLRCRHVDRTHRRYPGVACYHAQQTAEKYIKAILILQGRTFPWSHDLPALYALCAGSGTTLIFRQADVTTLTLYATDVRYPGLMPPPTLAQARQAVLMAGRIRRTSRRVLGLR